MILISIFMETPSFGDCQWNLKSNSYAHEIQTTYTLQGIINMILQASLG